MSNLARPDLKPAQSSFAADKGELEHVSLVESSRYTGLMLLIDLFKPCYSYAGIQQIYGQLCARRSAFCR